ncbi:MAG: class I tRNA ligase family protein [Candidatus Paceibacterota bacterium]
MHSKDYNHRKIESKWQKIWAKQKIYATKEDSNKKKFYILDMFPYPSGEGLHVGHPKGYIATDIISRMKRMQGHSVLHPMGFDAFGLPAENYAIKTKTNPAIAVAKNVKRYKKQLEIFGFDYDWSREVNTTDPAYYKWTQWIFLKLFEKGLAYESFEPINWCPSCKTGLANEDVEDGLCERCSSVVEKKPMRQWVLRITDYAERLLADLDAKDKTGGPILNWPNSIIELQKNWIGKSEGSEISFKVSSLKFQVEEEIRVFTTRADTLFGVTYVVLAPESKLLQDLKPKIQNWDEIVRYIVLSKNKTEIERTAENKEKTGVELKGIKAINPANNEEVSIWVADYVLADYGTGAVMAVPAHDERDFAFAKKYNLPIKEVIAPYFKTVSGPDAVRADKKTEKRKTVYVILKHWQEDKFLCLDWQKFNWHSFIIGGVEDGEDVTETAKREIHEETGFKNAKFIRRVGGEVHSHYFAGHKDVNRYSLGHTLYFELVDGEQDEVSESEKAKHSPVWIERAKMPEFLNLPNNQYAWGLFDKEQAFVGHGVLINSSKFNDTESALAKKEITEFAGGKMITKYKLRDWVFSRQRYWGEPIPLVHCAQCALETDRAKAKTTLNFYYEPVWRDLKSGVKTVETRALNPEEKGRYFGDFKVGDLLLFSRKDQKTRKVREELVYRVKSSRVYKNFDEVFKDKSILSQLSKKNFRSAKELEIAYSAFGANYVEKIKQNGLVAWEIEPVTVAVPVPEKDLPVKLPKVKSYEPTGTGESPLAAISKWVNVKCPKCKGPAKRETNTMPQWAGSSWYYIAYCISENLKSQETITKQISSNNIQNKIKYWLPVDFYVGGAEHATRHLIYARFWHKFLLDIGAVSTVEPFTRLQTVGLIMGEDGRKMSKRWGNVVNPDDISEKVGADTLRLYEMFLGPFDQAIAWSTEGIAGSRRFLERVWRLQYKLTTDNQQQGKLEILFNQTIKKVSEDISEMKFNTAISSLMILLNEIEAVGKLGEDYFKILLKLLAPFAPHITEELWSNLVSPNPRGRSRASKKSIHLEAWPTFDPAKIQDSTAKIAIQISGKTRAILEIDIGANQAEIEQKARQMSEVSKWLNGKKLIKTIYVKGRLLNFVVSDIV